MSFSRRVIEVEKGSAQRARKNGEEGKRGSENSQSGIDGTRELSERRDETDRSLLDLLVRIGAAEATGNGSESSCDSALCDEETDVREQERRGGRETKEKNDRGREEEGEDRSQYRTMREDFLALTRQLIIDP